jgi:hypothetical protein
VTYFTQALLTASVLDRVLTGATLNSVAPRIAMATRWCSSAAR